MGQSFEGFKGVGGQGEAAALHLCQPLPLHLRRSKVQIRVPVMIKELLHQSRLEQGRRLRHDLHPQAHVAPQHVRGRVPAETRVRGHQKRQLSIHGQGVGDERQAQLARVAPPQVGQPPVLRPILALREVAPAYEAFAHRPHDGREHKDLAGLGALDHVQLDVVRPLI